MISLLVESKEAKLTKKVQLPGNAGQEKWGDVGHRAQTPSYE